MTAAKPETLEEFAATSDSWFAHLALSVPGEGCTNEWLEPVTDEQYGQLK